MKKAIFNGIISGIIGGILLGVLHTAFMTPLILKAEVYEERTLAPREEEGGKRGEAPLWKRALLTFSADVVLGVAYGLLLSLIYSYSRGKGIKKGILLGTLAFIFLNLIPGLPGLGLPPNPPGVEAIASTGERQQWWLLVIISEVIGVLAFLGIKKAKVRWLNGASSSMLGILAFILIISIPFWIGAPSELKDIPFPHGFLIGYRIVSFVISLTFWLVLGLLIALLSERTGKKEIFGDLLQRE